MLNITRDRNSFANQKKAQVVYSLSARTDASPGQWHLKAQRQTHFDPAESLDHSREAIPAFVLGQRMICQLGLKTIYRRGYV